MVFRVHRWYYCNYYRHTPCSATRNKYSWLLVLRGGVIRPTPNPPPFSAGLGTGLSGVKPMGKTNYIASLLLRKNSIRTINLIPLQRKYSLYSMEISETTLSDMYLSPFTIPLPDSTFLLGNSFS